MTKEADYATLQLVIDETFGALGVTDNEAALVEIERLRAAAAPAPDAGLVEREAISAIIKSAIALKASDVRGCDVVTDDMIRAGRKQTHKKGRGDVASIYRAMQSVAPAPSGRDPATIEALKIAEAALSDIGDAERQDGDDVAWCEKRASEALHIVRRALAAPAAQLTEER